MYLKTGSIIIGSETIEIVQLNALGRGVMLEFHEKGGPLNMIKAYAAVVKYGTKKWRDAEVDDIVNMLPQETIEQIVSSVIGLSEIDTAKNSDSGPGDDSSSV